MTTAIAAIALTVISIGLALGNYWFTYGLWPRSWVSFAFFAVASMLVMGALQAVVKGDD